MNKVSTAIAEVVGAIDLEKKQHFKALCTLTNGRRLTRLEGGGYVYEFDCHLDELEPFQAPAELRIDQSFYRVDALLLRRPVIRFECRLDLGVAVQCAELGERNEQTLLDALKDQMPTTPDKEGNEKPVLHRAAIEEQHESGTILLNGFDQKESLSCELKELELVLEFLKHKHRKLSLQYRQLYEMYELLDGPSGIIRSAKHEKAVNDLSIELGALTSALSECTQRLRSSKTRKKQILDGLEHSILLVTNESKVLP